MNIEDLMNKLGDNMVEVIDDNLRSYLEEGINYELEGDLKQAEELYAKADKTGHPLGNKAYEGFKIRTHITHAKSGNKEAQYTLGQRYEVGIGVAKDKNEAKKWYQEAAEQKQPEAMLKMGDFARDNKEWIQAYDWYIKTIRHTEKFVSDEVMYDLHIQAIDSLEILSCYVAQNKQEKINTEHKQVVIPQTPPQTQSPLPFNAMHVYEFYDQKGLKLYEIAARAVFSIKTEYDEKRGNKTYHLELNEPCRSKEIRAFSYKLKAY